MEPRPEVATHSALNTLVHGWGLPTSEFARVSATVEAVVRFIADWESPAVNLNTIPTGW